MQLKNYQQKSLDGLKDYLLALKKFTDDKEAAQIAFLKIANEKYKWVKEIGAAPFVCIKVPTAGGKTFIAAHSVGEIFQHYLSDRNDTGLVMWFVPSDAIKQQTLNNLRNRKHPYREVLDERFGNKVMLFDLTEAKSIKKSDLADNLCIIVSTLAAFRRNNTEWLKAYQDNGALMNHFEGLNANEFGYLDKSKDGEIIYSLANVIKLHNPLVIADEGHNVQTDLSFEMLGNINPAFVLEFTATPRNQSNVIVEISAIELKAEHMIKMPMFLQNKTPWQETISEGIAKLKSLDALAKKEKEEYIRPIMLIQAEPERDGKDTVSVDTVLKFLKEESKIGAEEIAVQTAKLKELPSAEVLSSRDCKIKYIITINALKEGWDCPFAYILVSVSNMKAAVSVEQTIGRIMRLPNAKEKSNPALNSAYIFAATNNFNQAADMVIKGLQANGYEDVRIEKDALSVLDNNSKKKIKKGEEVLPYLNIKDGKTSRRLDYVGDLIGEENILKDAEVLGTLHFVENSQLEKIDVATSGGFVVSKAGKLNLINRYKDFTKENLLKWLRENIQRKYISGEEMGQYITRTVDNLLLKYSIAVLNTHRYLVQEEIEKQIDKIVGVKTTKTFEQLEKSELLATKGENFIFPQVFELANVSPANFTKHLYETASKMNGEESSLANHLDGLPNIAWWFRNPEIGGFYIQGWLKPKFYPDFVVKTKKGNYFVLEYKGEHLAGSDDTDYKVAIGNKWAELASDKYHFCLVNSDNMNAIVNEIAKF